MNLYRGATVVGVFGVRVRRQVLWTDYGVPRELASARSRSTRTISAGVTSSTSRISHLPADR